MSSRLFPFVIYCLLMAAGGCRKNDHHGTPNPPDKPKEGVLVKTSVFGRVVDEADKPLKDVAITAGSASTTTDEDGVYMLRDVMLDEARGYIKATKAGYFHGSRVFVSIEDNTTYPAVIKLLAQKTIGNISAAAGGTATASNGMKVILPAGAIEGYTGQVNVVGSYMNPTSADFFARMPGNLDARNSRGERGVLLSYGMAHLDLLDDKGNSVKIKNGMQATITLPVPGGLEAPATIPMWHFDEVKGIWEEEGSGTFNDGVYTGKVAHFSAWNFDAQPRPIDLETRMRLQWDPNYLGLISDLPDMDPLAMRLRRLRVIHQVRYKGQLIHSEIIPVPMPAPGSTTTDFSFTRQIPGHPGNGSSPEPGDIKSTIHLLQPGEDDYPKAPDYKPEGPDSNTGPAGSNSDGQGPIPIDEQQVDPNKPQVTHQGIIPPYTPGGGGTGETIVNVNGRVVDCAGKPVVNGKVKAELRAGTQLIKTLHTDIFTGTIHGETRAMFTAEYFFDQQLPNRVDNVTIIVSDYTSGKKSKPLKVNVNPSVAYMIPEPIRVCEDPVIAGPVYNGNFSITDEASLQQFVAGGYAEVTGMFTIQGPAVDNLNGITALVKAGALQIINTSLTGLGQLARLEQITGSIRIDNNRFLNAADFNALTTKKLTGGIYVSGNNVLASLRLPSIENIAENGQAFVVDNNPALATLYMPALKNVNSLGNLLIRNTALTNLDFLENATGKLAAGGAYGLTIAENKKLQDIRGIRNITVERSFVIDDNLVLSSLEGLKLADQMQEVSLYIRRNPLLAAISLSHGSMTGGGGIIAGNTALKTISLPNTVSFPTVDIMDNPQLTSISGPKVKTIGHIAVYNNALLTSIQFPALETIDGQLYVGNNAVLASLDLPLLQTVGDRFLIENNPALRILNGFNNLRETKSSFDIKSSVLTELKGFTKLQTVHRWMNILADDAPLTAITGFSSFMEVSTLSSFVNTLTIRGKNIGSLSGFRNFRKAAGLSVINTAIVNMDDFSALTSLAVLDIRQNPRLVHIRGLSGLSTLSANLYIVQNDLLTSVDGLEKITTMPDGGNSSIDISGNASLKNLNGIQNISSIKGHLSVTSNASLTSLCGINKLVSNNGIGGSYYVASNSYNPTVQDIKDGKCSK